MDEKREMIREKFSHMIGEMDPHISTELLEDYVEKIEESIFQFTLSRCEEKNISTQNTKFFLRFYMNKAIHLYDNLRKDSYIHNESLWERVKSGELEVEKLAFYSPMEIFPEHWKEIMERKIATDEFLYQDHESIVTDRYTCRRCKQNHCTFYVKQVRSIDEPSTVFIRCLNCQNRWTEG